MPTLRVPYYFKPKIVYTNKRGVPTLGGARFRLDAGSEVRGVVRLPDGAIVITCFVADGSPEGWAIVPEEKIAEVLAGL